MEKMQLTRTDIRNLYVLTRHAWKRAGETDDRITLRTQDGKKHELLTAYAGYLLEAYVGHNPTKEDSPPTLPRDFQLNSL